MGKGICSKQQTGLYFPANQETQGHRAPGWKNFPWKSS